MCLQLCLSSVSLCPTVGSTTDLQRFLFAVRFLFPEQLDPDPASSAVSSQRSQKPLDSVSDFWEEELVQCLNMRLRPEVFCLVDPGSTEASEPYVQWKESCSAWRSPEASVLKAQSSWYVAVAPQKILCPAKCPNCSSSNSFCISGLVSLALFGVVFVSWLNQILCTMCIQTMKGVQLNCPLSHYQSWVLHFT